MVESTLRNWSGRSHAAVKAAIPPLLEPTSARRSGSAENGWVLATAGRISSSRNRA